MSWVVKDGELYLSPETPSDDGEPVWTAIQGCAERFFNKEDAKLTAEVFGGATVRLIPAKVKRLRDRALTQKGLMASGANSYMAADIVLEVLRLAGIPGVSDEQDPSKAVVEVGGVPEALPEKKFDFGVYAMETSCGTTACALGWACTLPFARRSGVAMKRSTKYSQRFDFFIDGRVVKESTYGLTDVAHRLFGLTVEEHDRLFVPDYDDGAKNKLPESATAKQVAREIRKFVKQSGVLA